MKTERKGYRKDVAFELCHWQEGTYQWYGKGEHCRKKEQCKPSPGTTHKCEMWTRHPLGESVFGQTLLCAFYVPKLGGSDANRNQKWSYMEGLTVKSTQVGKGGSRLD